MISQSRAILIIAICAVCTFAERALPFAVFKKDDVPDVIHYLGKVLPMAIMSTLVIYCIRDIQFEDVSGWLPMLIACGVTIALHLWKRNAFISILGSTAVYMIMVQLVF